MVRYTIKLRRSNLDRSTVKGATSDGATWDGATSDGSTSDGATFRATQNGTTQHGPMPCCYAATTTQHGPMPGCWDVKQLGRDQIGKEKNLVCLKKCCFRTNLQNKGLISADRGTRATLMRTIPRSLFKSYTKDLSFPIFELVFQYRLLPLSRDRQYRYNVMILAARLLLCMITSGKAPYRRFPAWILAQRRSAVILHMVASQH